MKVLILITLCLTSMLMSLQVTAKGFETDFDHKVQYKLTPLSDKVFALEVSRLGNAKFSRMNMFATRKAKKVCGAMDFSIKYLSGVEGFDDRRFKPNFIFPSLKVKITCPDN